MSAFELSADECRVLGTLIEKAQTTPGQYPLTLNALVTGCNQKNNRDPLTNFDEDGVLVALDRLRGKGITREAMLSGSRVAKYRHVAREALGVTTDELVLLAELMLRGPQSVGELRGRASRMHPIESLEACQATLDGMKREKPVEGGEARPPLVKELPPAPGTRAMRYVQLLCPGLHPLDHTARAGGTDEDEGSGGGLAERVEALEREIAALKERLNRLEARA